MDLHERLPVVFLHGTRVAGTMWAPVMEIVGREHPVAAPDMPGHGRRRGEPFTMEGAVRAATDAIDRLGGRALVAGMSLGGYVGIATAARRPEHVAGLVAMGCTLDPGGTRGTAFRAAGALAARDPERVDRASARGFRWQLPAPAAEAFLAGGLSSEVIPGTLTALSGMRPLAELASYPGPVWLLNGERDHFRKHEREFLRACRDGRLAVVPRRGHITLLAEPNAVARAVLDAAAVVESGRDRSSAA